MNTTLTQCETTDTAETCCNSATGTVRPRADIYELDNAWMLVLEMPGVDENGTDVALEKGVLKVTGEAAPFDTEGFQKHFGNLTPRRFERTFRLPDEVDTSAIDAQVKCGILSLRLPKAEAAMPQKVVVKAG